ncbi:uracil-DNA glycosylase family protein [Periweissella fabalis]|uniref:Uracil-DNA glycosylase family protein n=1 Tax=Periweissella fabalis TaxID=1070421 RepID=A0A7X6N2H3_9LACO|nr:uracil-DNA glycosylase family protein [Periweissella fabalis]MCM0599833.1 uracil-DNA glycosylase family protein [Periweissella fabalis]NKZ24112.1 uracil-DNA glycosylase family protein [Periweissella fabalis]
MNKFDDIFMAIKNDAENQLYTQAGIDPLYFVNPAAEIIIIGQAPGKKAQASQIVWHDQSGQRLRQWLAVSDDEFYHSGKFAILPMDFYFPGKGNSGDRPPRKNFAAKWHPQLIALMPQVRLIILVGTYAQKYYLHLNSKQTLTQVVRDYAKYQPKYFPIVHPSPMNQRWLKKNPWFEMDVIPNLQKLVRNILGD